MNCICRIAVAIGRKWLGGALYVMAGGSISTGLLAGQAPAPAAASCPVPPALAQNVFSGRVSVAAAGGDVAGKSSAASAKGAAAATAPSSPYRQWSVQVASYETFDQAQTLQQRLCQRGFDARVVGASRPYSVRVGRFATSHDALVVARRLRSPGLTVFVTPEWR
jgi:cell division protein FtsN